MREQLGLWARWWVYRLARQVHDPLHRWLDREGPYLVHRSMTGDDDE